MSFEGVQFVDRYGPEGPPSSLRICRGGCEGMGWVPWGEQAIPCAVCEGAKVCGWEETLFRIPWWVGRAVSNTISLSRREIHPPDWGTWKRWWVAFQCCVLIDLGYRPWWYRR